MGNLCSSDADNSDQNNQDTTTAATRTTTQPKDEKVTPDAKFTRKEKQTLGWLNIDIETPSPREVTRDELAKHVTYSDCWTILHGKVYNITPYLVYHPGGKRELMKGAGKDCTALFEKFHAYVQYEVILAKCYIGVLVEGGHEALMEGDEDEEDEE